MNITSLSTDQAPPISVPLRFFAVAPLFLLLAALMLALSDGNLFAAAQTPALLAATHCITLGFMAMVMMGATQQILPVVIGSPVPASRWVAWFTSVPLGAGTLSLCGGFMLGNAHLLNLAWPLLGTAFLVFIVASMLSLWRASARNVTKTAILLSICALAVAVSLGILLVRGFVTGAVLDYAALSAAHISLALGGWVMLLIVGVSYQVVPMVQITPAYPKWLTAVLAPALFAILLLNLALLLIGAEQLWIASAGISFWLLAAGFALVTLKLQRQRRRKVTDATLSFFRLGMLSLLLAALFYLASLLLPAVALQFRLMSAIAFIAGFAMSLIQGMLYKIIPFLVWFHLFRGGINAVKAGIPNMKEVIPDRLMWWHLWLHGGTLLVALLGPWLSAAAWLTALGLLLQGMLLSYAVFTGIVVYRRTLRRIELLAV